MACLVALSNAVGNGRYTSPMLGLMALLGIAAALLLALLVTMLAWEMVHPPRRTAAWAIARGLPSDPGEMDLEFEEWKMERPGGVRLPVWEIKGSQRSALSGQPNATTDDSLTAVFVHGWGHARVNSLQRIQPFLPLVERIVLYDLRGHGDSTGSSSTLGDHDVDDLLALLERLGPAGGRFVLIGHSMGSVIALRAAAAAMLIGQRSVVSGQPGLMIAGVIAYGPYCDFHRSLRGRLRVNGFPSRPLSDLALLVHRMRGIRPAAVVPQSLREMPVPLLVIHGVEDQVSPLEHARTIVEAAPDARLIEVEDAAHTDAHSVDQGMHDQEVREFIAKARAH